jgi:hypothetical protein
VACPRGLPLILGNKKQRTEKGAGFFVNQQEIPEHGEEELHALKIL